MKTPNLAGLVPAIVAPMNEDTSLDFGALRDYVEWILPQGIVALAVNTDAGEGPHLSREEKRRVLETVVKQVNGRVPVVSGVGAPYTSAAVELAKEARDAGADAFLCFPINAFRGAAGRDPVIIAYHEAIAKVGVPMILFQLQPDLGGVNYPPETLTELVNLDSVVAIKEATFDALVFQRTKAHLETLDKKITFMTGNDNFIMESFILGAEGALIGFGAIATQEQARMIAAVKARDYETAFALNRILAPLADAMFAQPVRDYRARLKEALVAIGVIPRATVRPPLLPLNPGAKAAVAKAVEAAGLLGRRRP